jgi:predicted phosphodiesterase
VRTLVVSDLHLGSAAGRDVLRGATAREALRAQARRADRLVLLGDTVELLEGQPRQALERALPILRELTAGVPEVVLVAGNHDHQLVARWLRERRAAGRPLRLAERVPRRASEALERVVGALGGGRVSVRYPGLWLAPGVYATHGHYVDALLVRGFPGAPGPGARPDDFERAPGPSAESVLRVLGAELPAPLRMGTAAGAGALRRLALEALPLVRRLPAVEALGPVGATLFGHRLGVAGLTAAAGLVDRLGIRARHVLFGHVHRAGPLPDDDADGLWRHGRTRLWNTGSWVFDPFLLSGSASRHPHPYWPGTGVVLEDGTPRTVRLLDDVPGSVLTTAR